MSIELELYLLALLYGFFVLLYKYVAQFYLHFYYTFFLINFIFIIAPSYLAYTIDFSGLNFNIYFLLLIINQLIISIPVLFYDKNKIELKNNNINLKNVYYLNLLLLVSFFYIYYATKFSQFNMLPIIYSILNDSVGLVDYRKVFWREGVSALPLGSLIRFISKYGMVTVTLLFYILNKKKYFGLFLGVTLVSATLEGTKSGLIMVLLPLVFLMYLNLFKFRLQSMPVLILMFIGTLYFSFTETNSDITEAFYDKFLSRVFLVPNNVAMHHFYITGNNYLYGNTISILAKFRGGFEKLFGSGVLDYDNFIYQHIFYDKFKYLPTLGGSANGPYFIYGWDDLGLFGVVLISILLIYVLHVIKKVFLEDNAILYYPVIILMLFILITSQNIFSWFLGIDTMAGMVFLKIFFINPSLGQKTDSYYSYLYLLAGFIFYIIGFISNIV